MIDAACAPRELSRLGRWSLVLGAALIVLLAAAFVAGFVGLLLGARVGWWVLGPAIAAQIAFVAGTSRRSDPPHRWRTVVTIVAVGWLIILTAGGLAQLVSDTSVDGRHYQSETTRAVARGWNPVREGPLFPRDNPYQPDAAPKAPAIVGATILRVTDSIEATRLVGSVLLVAAALVAIAGLEAAGARRWLALAGGVTLALNPVALSQLGTAMVDGIVGSLLISAIMLALLWVWRYPPITVLPALAGVLALLVNTKFTGLVYVGLIIIPVVLVAGLLARIGWRRVVAMAGAVVLAALVAMLALGYNPYVTNWLRHDHPLHPVYGPSALDIGAQYREGELEDLSEPERLLLSVFGASAAGVSDPELKVPLTFVSSEWSAFRSPSVRIGGFGPWFSAGLVLAFLALIGTILTLIVSRGRVEMRGDRTSAYTLLSAGGICLLATIVQPSAFLARFAPQLWFVPSLIAISVALVVGARILRAIAWIALAVLLVDALGVAGATIVWDRRDTDREEASLAKLRALSPLEANFGSWRRSEARRLREHGIRFVVVDRVTCPVPYVLSVVGGLARQPQLWGVPRPAGGVLLCPQPAPGARP